MPTIEVVEALRFFVREGVQWRELRAAAGRASGSTLRRRLDEWSATAVLRRVHVALVRMVRAGPDAAPWDVVVDSCSVRAKRGGELTGPNPTDRGKPGTKYHLLTDRNGLPLHVLASAANTHDSKLFEPLLETNPAVRGRRGRPGRPRRRPEKLHADKGYDYPRCRRYLHRRGIKVRIARRGIEAKTHLGRHRWVVERTISWVLRFKRLGLRYDRTETTLLPLLLLALTLINLRRLRQTAEL